MRWLRNVIQFYVDGFRNMTWGRELWILIILKLIILFLFLRIVFFRPAMAGKTDEQKSDTVEAVITRGTGGAVTSDDSN